MTEALASIISKILNLSTKGIWTLLRGLIFGLYNSSMPKILLTQSERESLKELKELRD